MQRFFTLLHLVYVGLGFSTNKVVLSSGGAAFFLYLFYLNQITMSKRLLLAIISLLLFSSSIYSQQPRIVILATGKLEKKLNVKATRFTAKAKEEIEALGGKAEVI